MRKNSNRSMIITATVLSALLFCSCGKVDDVPAMEHLRFRGYAIVSNGTDTITLYSAPISRSVYTVAKQVIAAGEFQAGTAAYNYVSGIITTVENK